MNVSKWSNEKLIEKYKEVSRGWKIAQLKDDLKLMEKIELEAYRRNINIW